MIALAAGGADGLGLGDNAKAALVSRGLAEMARLAEVAGGGSHLGVPIEQDDGVGAGGHGDDDGPGAIADDARVDAHGGAAVQRLESHVARRERRAIAGRRRRLKSPDAIVAAAGGTVAQRGAAPSAGAGSQL